MGSNHSTGRASANAEPKYSTTIAPASNQTRHEFATDISNSTSKDLRALAHDTAAEDAKTGPRQLQLGPAPSPLSTFATRLDEALLPLTRGEPIDLARVALHARPYLGTTLPSPDDQESMPGPTGPERATVVADSGAVAGAGGGPGAGWHRTAAARSGRRRPQAAHNRSSVDDAYGELPGEHGLCRCTPAVPARRRSLDLRISGQRKWNFTHQD